MQIVIDDGHEKFETSLALFIIENESAILDDPQWLIDVVACLNRGEVYHGGGGAAGEYSVSVKYA